MRCQKDVIYGLMFNPDETLLNAHVRAIVDTVLDLWGTSWPEKMRNEISSITNGSRNDKQVLIFMALYALPQYLDYIMGVGKMPTLQKAYGTPELVEMHQMAHFCATAVSNKVEQFLNGSITPYQMLCSLRPLYVCTVGIARTYDPDEELKQRRMEIARRARKLLNEEFSLSEVAKGRTVIIENVINIKGNTATIDL